MTDNNKKETAFRRNSIDIIDDFRDIRSTITEMDKIASLNKDEVPSVYFDFKDKLSQFLPTVYDTFNSLPKANQLLTKQEDVPTTHDFEEDDVYRKLYHIISYIGNISSRISLIEFHVSFRKECVPDEFYEFKRKFFQFLSSTELFTLDYKYNASLIENIKRAFTFAIADYDDDLEYLQDLIKQDQYNQNFFVNFCKFSSELKCGTTSQSSKASKQSKNA